MPTPKIEVKYGPITCRLHMIKRNGESLEKPLRQVGDIILSSITENVLQGGRYDGNTDSWRGGAVKWQPLSEVTKQLLAKKGKAKGRMLDRSQGGLQSSITADVKGDSLEIGTNKVYAAIHQKGGMAGRNKKVKIPARPYLVVQDEDIDEAMDILGKHINPATT